MIPKAMAAFLAERLPERALENRLVRDGGLCFVEFGSTDVDRLARLGVEVDPLGPQLVVCMWDETATLEIGGYLVVDNLAMGRPSMGGIRMLPDLTPDRIHNLARGMTLKNAAAHLPFGGGKSGIVPGDDLPPEAHAEVVRGFARLLARYRDLYLPGPDVGTNDADMKTVAIENGLDSVLSKPADMGGNRIDQLGAAAGGVVIALQALLEEMPRLRALPQFAGLRLPPLEAFTVLVQGFGAVGAHAARMLGERLPGARVVGISDAAGYLYDEGGLPVDALFSRWPAEGVVTHSWFLEQMTMARGGVGSRRPLRTKYSSSPDDLLRENAFCLIPAAPVANYLDTDPASQPSMTVDRMGRWAVCVEGANTYSPDPARKAARARMERAVYRQRGVLIATDYLVNSGGVIFAAQELLIPTPESLRIPAPMLGDRRAVERWLAEHAADFEALAERRRAAGEAHREDAIRANMRELVDLLVSDADMLPCEAAERISVRRIAARESGRTAADLMEPIPTVAVTCTFRDAAATLLDANCPIAAVVGPRGDLVGVVTEWDVTRATAQGAPPGEAVTEIMTRQVIAVAPEDGILDMVRKLEHHDISAMPVVAGNVVQGMVSADLLARRSLFRLLQSQPE
ncbi:MAG: CBS domain-containing protein [Candidatus Rokubacteria bacterium]|nr:CBS domain-containing protein [Candidatus Rokubacteria bacterium]